MTIDLRHGDSREVLKAIPDNSIDSTVTDPPYALVSIVKRFGAKNAAPAKDSAGGAYARASAGFMGQQWDTGEVAFDVDFWREVWRVMKPGGFLLAFGGTRTYHRLAVAIEDAGFEIRDSILSTVRNDTAVGRFLDSLSEEQAAAFAQCLDDSEFGGLLAWVYGSGFPKALNVSKAIAKRRKEDAGPVRVICRAIRAAMEAKGVKSRDLVDQFDGCHPRLIDHWAARDTDSQPALPTNDQWERLRVALDMPDDLSAEVRRLNDRKGTHGEEWSSAEVTGSSDSTLGFSGKRFSGDPTNRALAGAAAQWEGWKTALKPAFEPIVVARKPVEGGSVAANVLKHGTGAMNIAASAIGSPPGRYPPNVVRDDSDQVRSAFPIDGQGGAARFFYSAKADAEDRLGSNHPTVKPVDLMRYFVTLVTPPGGTVLDPFAGSGSTGIAANGAGFNSILIEREAAFVADIRRRIAWSRGEGRVTALEQARDMDTDKASGLDTPLFGGEV